MNKDNKVETDKIIDQHTDQEKVESNEKTSIEFEENDLSNQNIDIDEDNDKIEISNNEKNLNQSDQVENKSLKDKIISLDDTLPKIESKYIDLIAGVLFVVGIMFIISLFIFDLESFDDAGNESFGILKLFKYSRNILMITSLVGLIISLKEIMVSQSKENNIYAIAGSSILYLIAVYMTHSLAYLVKWVLKVDFDNYGGLANSLQNMDKIMMHSRKVQTTSVTLLSIVVVLGIILAAYSLYQHNKNSHFLIEKIKKIDIHAAWVKNSIIGLVIVGVGFAGYKVYDKFLNFTYIDPFENISLVCSGVEKDNVSCDVEEDFYDDNISPFVLDYKLEYDNDNVSNGDEILVTAVVNDTFASENKVKFRDLSQKYKVTGLATKPESLKDVKNSKDITEKLEKGFEYYLKDENREGKSEYGDTTFKFIDSKDIFINSESLTKMNEFESTGELSGLKGPTILMIKVVEEEYVPAEKSHSSAYTESYLVYTYADDIMIKEDGTLDYTFNTSIFSGDAVSISKVSSSRSVKTIDDFMEANRIESDLYELVK